MFCKQTVQNLQEQAAHFAAPGQVLHCLQMSHKMDLRLEWVKLIIIMLSMKDNGLADAKADLGTYLLQANMYGPFPTAGNIFGNIYTYVIHQFSSGKPQYMA